MVLPIFLYASLGIDNFLVYSGVLSVLWMALLSCSVTRQRWLFIALLPLYLLAAIDAYVVLHYETRLASGMLLVFAQNTGDAGEFFESHLASVLVHALAYFSVYGAALYFLRDYRTPRRPIAAGAILVALCACVVGVGHKNPEMRWKGGALRYVLTIASIDSSVPFGWFVQAWVASKVFATFSEAAARAESFRFHPVRTQEPEEPELYVLVVGESSRRDHWSLFGYERDTTPRLRKTKNILPFTDVLTQAPHTAVAVPLILTRGVAEDAQRAQDERSIVTAMGELGFRTYWISTQARDHLSGVINRYSAEADVERYVERQHDDALLRLMRQEVLSESARYRKQFVVLHGQGSHFNYPSRYPSSFARFPKADPATAATNRSDHHSTLIDTYDNTVAFTDQVLGELIDTLQTTGRRAAVLYISDHSENLQDDERMLFGHMLPTKWDLPVPMFLWYSDAYAADHAQALAAAQRNAGRPTNSRSVFYTLLDLVNARIDDPQQRRLSLLSEEFACPRRYVRKGSEVLDFDQAFPRNSEQELHTLLR